MPELIRFLRKINSLGPMRATSRGGFVDRPMACECNYTLVLAWRFFDAHFINEPREDDWAWSSVYCPPDKTGQQS